MSTSHHMSVATQQKNSWKRAMRVSVLRALQVFVVLLLVSNCQDLGINPEGPGKLVLGVGVEGIRLGDSPQTVRAKLGTPSSVGDIYGAYRGWSHYTYADDSARVKLTLAFIDNGQGLGPLDAITCGPAYQGNTTEGLGIGSTRADVHKVYGVPARSASQPDPPVISDSYCISERRLEIEYTNSVAISFTFGYFLPWPKEDPRNPCGGKQ